MSAEQQTTTTSTPDVAPPATAGGELSAEQIEALRPRIVDAIKTVYDPEIPVNIYELGPDL